MDDFYGEYCWVYAIALAKRFNIDVVHGLVPVGGSKFNDVVHVVVKIEGKYYDASGEVTLSEIRSEFGGEKLIKFKVSDVIKYLGKRNLYKSKLFIKASRLVDVKHPPEKIIKTNWKEPTPHIRKSKKVKPKERETQSAGIAMLK